MCDPCTVAHQVPLSTGFSKEEYWSGSLNLTEMKEAAVDDRLQG